MQASVSPQDDFGPVYEARSRPTKIAVSGTATPTGGVGTPPISKYDAVEYIVPTHVTIEVRSPTVAAPAEGPTYMDSIKSNVASAAETASTAASNVSEAIKTSNVLPKAQSLASGAASAAYQTAQTASEKIAQSGAIPKAQELASRAVTTTSSTLAAGAAKAKDVIAGAVTSIGESSLPYQKFTTPASAAPLEAHYEVASAGFGPTHYEFPASIEHHEIAFVPGAAVYSPSGPTNWEFVGSAVEDIRSVPLKDIHGVSLPRTTSVSTPVNFVDVGSTTSVGGSAGSSIAARAGDVVGTVAGSVGGTLSTAASLAKNAALEQAQSLKPAGGGHQGEDVLLRASSAVGSIAGTVAGTLVTVAAAAKEAAVSAVSSVTRHHEEKAVIPTGETAVVVASEHQPIFDVNDIETAPYDEGNLIDIYTETGKNQAGRQSALEKAATAAGYAAGVATKAKETVAGAAADTYSAAKETVVPPVQGAKNSILATTTEFYNHAAHQTAQWTQPTTSTKYELVESDLQHPVTDIRASAPSGFAGETDYSQRALPAPSSIPNQNASAGFTSGAGEGNAQAGTRVFSLLTDDAIRAVATPADSRTAEEQAMVDRLLLSRDLSSVGQPNIEFGSGSTAWNDQPSSASGFIGRSNVASALPADMHSSFGDAPSDNASTRSIPPASVSRSSLSDDDVYETSRPFVVDAVLPTDPIPHELASHSPATSTIVEEDPATIEEERAEGVAMGVGQDSGYKPKKSHAILEKAAGKLESGLGKVLHKENLVADGQERHVAGAAEMEHARALAH